MPKSHINPSSLFDSKQYGFSQVVKAELKGSLCCISGQVAMDVNENIIGSDLGEQARHSLVNLSLAIKAAGGKLSDIMSCGSTSCKPSMTVSLPSARYCGSFWPGYTASNVMDMRKFPCSKGFSRRDRSNGDHWLIT